MIGDPLIRYTTASDGVRLAYWTLGEGTPFVMLPSLPHSHIWLEWEQSEWRRGYELAASRGKVVRYDGRGTGLSQRDVTDFSLEAMLRDLEAIMDELGEEPAVIEGVVNTVPVAVAYTVQHPERVSHLILWIPVVDTSVHRNNSMLQAARQVMETDWDMFCETVAHGLLGWDQHEAARKFAQLVRAGITQETARILVPQMHTYNVWDLLPEVRCPTLVLHRPELPMLPPGTAERVAALIPGAQLALFEGTSSAPFVGDWRAIIQAIGAFLGFGLRTPARNSGGRALRLLSMRTEALSAREQQVVELVAEGLTNREIAAELVLAPKTVENHIGRILTKLDLRSRAQLAAYAVERRIGRDTA